ncbi:hypothetical protein Avbf_02911 [Armadillidium vulgare]|nr:hypothetical protein Avbf_02911 [Armadillidium vulgare]
MQTEKLISGLGLIFQSRLSPKELSYNLYDLLTNLNICRVSFTKEESCKFLFGEEKGRNVNGGGVMLRVCKSINCQRLYINTELEIVAIEIFFGSNNKNNSALVISILTTAGKFFYKSSSKNINKNPIHENLIKHRCQKAKARYIVQQGKKEHKQRLLYSINCNSLLIQVWNKAKFLKSSSIRYSPKIGLLLEND